MLMKDLIGQTLIRVEKIAGGVLLTMDSGKKYGVEADGDCCSNGWIGSMIVPDLPATITGFAGPCDYGGVFAENLAAAKNIPTIDNVLSGEMCPLYLQTGDKGECLSVFAFVLSTRTGWLRMDIWNDSNGYYGSTVSVTELIQPVKISPEHQKYLELVGTLSLQILSRAESEPLRPVESYDEPSRSFLIAARGLKGFVGKKPV